MNLADDIRRGGVQPYPAVLFLALKREQIVLSGMAVLGAYHTKSLFAYPLATFQKGHGANPISSQIAAKESPVSWR